MCDPQDLREAIDAAKKAVAEQKERGDSFRDVAFSTGSYHVAFTSLSFQQLALLAEAAEGVAHA